MASKDTDNLIDLLDELELDVGLTSKKKSTDQLNSVKSKPQTNKQGSQNPFDDFKKSQKKSQKESNPFDDFKKSQKKQNPFDEFHKNLNKDKSPFDSFSTSQAQAQTQYQDDTQNQDQNDENQGDKPKRKKELYLMDPIYIPSAIDEDRTPQQEAIIEQFKDVPIECHYCQDPINYYDEKIMIGQNFYHIDHVQCNKCGKPLDPDKILELGDDIFCDECFETECDLGKNLCGYCNEEIIGDLYIKALDRVWHPNHFFCSYCGCKFDESTPFFEISGKPYCEEDYRRLFGKVCKACNEAIGEDFVSALEMNWHPECFKCHVCDKSLVDDAFYTVDNELYCEYHYQEKQNLLCEYCKKPVDKRYVFALNKKWHPNHFFCAFCKNVLYTDTGFREYNEKPYCKECFIRLYG